MSKKVQHSLEKVDESIEQLISMTIEWLSLETHTTEQLVLNVERIKALHRLQKLMRSELRSETGSGERVWQIANIVIATVTRFILDAMSKSIQYKLCHEPRLISLSHGLSSSRMYI